MIFHHRYRTLCLEKYAEATHRRVTPESAESFERTLLSFLRHQERYLFNTEFLTKCQSEDRRYSAYCTDHQRERKFSRAKNGVPVETVVPMETETNKASEHDAFSKGDGFVTLALPAPTKKLKTVIK